VAHRKDLGGEKENRRITNNVEKSELRGLCQAAHSLQCNRTAICCFDHAHVCLINSCSQEDLGYFSSIGHGTPGGNGLNNLSPMHLSHLCERPHLCHSERHLFPHDIKSLQINLYICHSSSKGRV